MVTGGNSFKLLFGLIDIEQKRKMSITRQEREKLVLDLYYNQGKNIREIAQEARMSFRDIGSILNKADEGREQKIIIMISRTKSNNKNKNSRSSYLYLHKLTSYFLKVNTPIQVAVALNLKESEITRFYKEYCKLNQMHDLNIVYEELKGDIIPFLKLYRSARSAGMSEEHVVNLLRIANDDNNLPAVEYRYE